MRNLLIIQPGASNFDITATLVFLGTRYGFLRDIATKLVRENFSTLVLSFYSCFLFIFSGSILPPLLKASPACLRRIVSPVLAAMIAAGCLGFFFMTEVVRLGDISVMFVTRDFCSLWRLAS